MEKPLNQTIDKKLNFRNSRIQTFQEKAITP